MIYIKKRRYKPIYKKFLNLKQNVLNSQKLLGFKKRKWKKLISYIQRRQTEFGQDYKLYDHNIYFLPKYSYSFNNKFRYNLQLRQRLKLFYGKLLKRYMKKQILSIVKNSFVTKKPTIRNKNILKLFENRLDTILYRAHFTPNIKIARQLIIHRHISVNDKLIQSPLHQLKPGDAIKISTKIHKQFAYNLLYESSLWPLPPKYLQINYRIFQIRIINEIETVNITSSLPFWFDVNTIVKSLKY